MMATNMQLPPLTLVLLLALAAGDVSAGDGHAHEQGLRGHGAHIHGIARLNLALDGDQMHVELNSPAANVLGFEHAPSSDADHAALDQAFAALKDGAHLFGFNSDAGCTMEDVKIATPLMQDEHGIHEHEGETHAGIEAVYRFACTNPDGLEQLTVELFEIFPGTEHLKVQFVVGDHQGAAELTPTRSAVTF